MAIVGEKDEHVLAAALACQAPFLLTLDVRLAERVNLATLDQAALPIRALSPGDFIKTILPEHADFPRVRE